MSKTLRFNLSTDISARLIHFNNKYKESNSSEYKKQWKVFLEENRQTIADEERRLENMGFSGDVIKKMYTSVKYYIRKKQEDDGNNEPKKRRAYVHIDKKFLTMIDEHIETNKNEDNYTPAQGFTEFCNMYETELTIEKDRLRTSSELNMDEIEFKIKKTYKNRYFILNK